MVLTVTYVATAMLIAPVLFVAAEWVGNDVSNEQASRPPHRAAYCLLAAALWPVLVVGLAQFAVVAVVRRVLVARSVRISRPTVDVIAEESDTARLPRVVVPCVRVQVGTPVS